jgi:hypothetical protein
MTLARHTALVQVQVRLVHEVDREHAVHGVFQRASRADPLEQPAALRQHAAADDQIQLVQRQLAVTGAGRLDAGELVGEVGQIRPHRIGAKAESRDRAGSVGHGLSFARRHPRAHDAGAHRRRL